MRCKPLHLDSSLFVFSFPLTSQRVVAAYQFTAEEAPNRDIIYLVERRIKATNIVAHFEQVVDIDDVSLTNLHEAVV